MFNKFIYLSLFCSLLFSESEIDGLNKINQIREESGLNQLAPNKNLWKSAKNHTIYLTDLNEGIKHIQNVKTEYFTGTNPWDRAINVGYNNRSVSENISYGLETYDKSIDLLMTAIYHRFGFLNFNIDEIGYFKINKIATYNMGNSIISAVCSKNNVSEDINYPICEKSDFISRSDYINKIKLIELKNPEYVIFPAPDSSDNLPAFYDETPNPVPDKVVTGNPISIQFNESKVSSVEIKSFKVFDGSTELSSRLISKQNDPNHKFSDHQFALFPLERLKWGRTYTAEIKALVDGKSMFKRWTFYTKRLDGDIYSIKVPDTFSYEKNSTFFLTFDAQRFGRITSFSTDCSSVSFVDYNTLELNLNANCLIDFGSPGQMHLLIK